VNQVDEELHLEPTNSPFSRPLSWRECVGVEPTQEQEAAPATVLKPARLHPQQFYGVRTHTGATR